MPVSYTKKAASRHGRTRARENVCGSCYRAQYATTAKEMVSQGFSDEEICCELGVELRILERWQLEQPELRDALSRTEQQKTALAEKRLLDLALGYEIEGKKIFWSKGKVPIGVTLVEHRPPDLNTLMFMLNNKCSERWQKNPQMKSPPRPPAREQSIRAFWVTKVMEEIERCAVAQEPFVERWGNDDV